MNIVKTFRSITERLNELNKCDFCWEFSAPLFEDANSIVQVVNPCCVQIRLLNYTDSKTNDHRNGFVTGTYTDYRFTLEVMKQSQMGLNVDNEIKGYSLDTSKWETIYYPIRECLSDSNFIDWCAELGLQVEVQTWTYSPFQNKGEDNYDGWKITAHVRIRNEYQ